MGSRSAGGGGLAVAVAVFLASAAPALSPARAGLPSGDPACDRAMPTYSGGLTRPSSARKLDLDPPGAGKLLYLPVRHTSDPADRQLGVIEREMRRFRPTRVLYEGDSRAVGADRRDTVARYGESGFARWIARELEVPAASFDVPAGELIDFLAGRFEPEEVKIYFVLREIWLLRDRQGRPERETRELAAGIIRGELLPRLPPVLETEEEFARAFARRWPPGVRWTRPRAEWFDPYRAGGSAGGLFIPRLEQAATVFRDVHMYRTIANAVRAGDRVFALAGAGHLPVQTPALRCALPP